MSQRSVEISFFCKERKTAKRQNGCEVMANRRGAGGPIKTKSCRRREMRRCERGGDGGIVKGIQGKMNCVFLHSQTRDDNSKEKLCVSAHACHCNPNLSQLQCQFVCIGVWWSLKTENIDHFWDVISPCFVFNENLLLTPLSNQQPVFLAARFSPSRATSCQTDTHTRGGHDI